MHYALLFEKKTHIVARNIILSAIINLVLNLIFVPKYGFVAASITTLVSYIILAVMQMISCSYYLKWAFPKKSILNILFAVTGMFLSIYYFKNLLIYLSLNGILILILTVSIGIITYFSILYLLKEFTREEIEKILSIISRKFKRKYAGDEELAEIN
jgi:O-antigen/teichoic acid export membrane protein